MTDPQENLVCAFAFDEAGRARGLDWEEFGTHAAKPGARYWVHLNRGGTQAQKWLQEESGLDSFVCEALLAEETRPRCDSIGDGLLLILRGVNLNPGADPEDMVSIRMWADERRVISVRLRRLMAVQDMRDELESSQEAWRTSDLVATISARLVDRMGPSLATLDDEIDGLEEDVLQAQSHGLRRQLHTLRGRAITLRRYIAPQREAMTRLLNERAPWVAENHRARARMRETADRITRYVEDLDAARERASVIQDELANRLAEQLNTRLYLLSIVAAIFLPLGFVTGLLGINVGGMPGAETSWAFALVTLALAFLGGVEIYIFRRLGWI
jgi:zinc transporter